MPKIVRKTMTADRAVALGLMAAPAILLIEYARLLALPTHFV